MGQFSQRRGTAPGRSGERDLMPLSKKAKRILWIVAGIVVAVPIIVILVVFLKLGALVKMGVEVGGTKVLGAPTHLGSASVSVLQGKVTLKDLAVENPKGFTSPTFVKANLIRVQTNVFALTKKELHIREVTLAGPEFTYEYAGGKSNVGVFMDRFKGEEKKPAEAPQQAKERGEPMKLKIDLLRVTDAKVRLVVAGKPMTVTLPSIEIRNIADGNGNGLPPDQVVKILLAKVLGSVESTAGGAAKQAVEATKQAAEAAEAAKNVGKDVTEQGKRLGEGVQKMFKK